MIDATIIVVLLRTVCLNGIKRRTPCLQLFQVKLHSLLQCQCLTMSSEQHKHLFRFIKSIVSPILILDILYLC